MGKAIELLLEPQKCGTMVPKTSPGWCYPLVGEVIRAINMSSEGSLFLESTADCEYRYNELSPNDDEKHFFSEQPEPYKWRLE